jgi:hypothetical protein
MTDKPSDVGPRPDVEIIHLPKHRGRRSLREEVAQDLELSIAQHFREQNTLLQEMNRSLSEKVQRLTTGVERLVDEMHGVRTGKKEEAFARVGPSDCSPDLPTVSAEAALLYTLTAGDIADELGFHASQIGVLLSERGLGWTGNSDYQEIGRNKRKSLPKFWHRDVPEKLRKVLDRGEPEKKGISDKAVLAVFRKWAERKESRELFDNLETTDTPH